MTRALMLLAGCLAAAPARALRVPEGGFVVTPTSVLLTRTITVTAVIENDRGLAGEMFGVEVYPQPGSLVRLLRAFPPAPFSCTETGGGTHAGRWIFEALAPGTVRFVLEGTQQVCLDGTADTPARAESGPVTLRPLAVRSELVCVPAVVAPGDRFSLELTLRNDSDEDALFQPPRADADLLGRRVPAADLTGPPVVTPADAVRAGRLVLSPGRTVVFRWPCLASETGEARFQVVGAGLIMRTPLVRVRTAADFSLTVPPPPGPSAIGREHVVRALLRAGGDATVSRPGAGIAWSPPDAARLVASAPPAATLLSGEGPAAAVASFTLELLKAGPLLYTVSAWGTETDSGRILRPKPAARLLPVQAPPRLELSLLVPSATVLVGARVPFRVMVRNRASSPTTPLAPVVLFQSGDVELHSFSPMYQGVFGGGTSYFAGAFTPAAPGSIAFAVQATARDDAGGPWITAVSRTATVLAEPVPRLEVYALSDRAWQGTTASIRFSLVNAARERVRVTAVSAALSSPNGSLGSPPVRGLPLVLDPGRSATLTMAAYLPPDKSPYQVSASLTLSATLTAYALPFQVQPGARRAVLACPRTTAIVDVEPDPGFRPPLDPALRVEWTQTFTAAAGVSVLTPGGATVRTLREPGPAAPGWHEAFWDGRTAAGAVAAPGRYLLRVAGIGASAWHADHPFTVEKP